MWTTIENLREISRCCHEGRPLDEDLSRWLATSLERFLAHECRSVDDALGLHFPRGGVPWWLEEAMRRRDAALRELAHRFYPGRSVSARARAIHDRANNYAGTAWRYDALHAEMPHYYAGTPKEPLWRAFKSGAPMPLGERQLRTILGG